MPPMRPVPNVSSIAPDLMHFGQARSGSPRFGETLLSSTPSLGYFGGVTVVFWVHEAAAPVQLHQPVLFRLAFGEPVRQRLCPCRLTPELQLLGGDGIGNPNRLHRVSPASRCWMPRSAGCLQEPCWRSQLHPRVWKAHLATVTQEALQWDDSFLALYLLLRLGASLRLSCCGLFGAAVYLICSHPLSPCFAARYLSKQGAMNSQ